MPHCAIGAQGAFFMGFPAHPTGGDVGSTLTYADRQRRDASTGTSVHEKRIVVMTLPAGKKC